MTTAVNQAVVKPPKPIDLVVTYKNENLVKYVAELKNISAEEAAKRLIDLYRWLWLSSLRNHLYTQHESVPDSLMIGPELGFIDDLWHAFILFTRDYQTFCQEYLGGMIHHDPLEQEVKESFRILCETDPEAAREVRKKEMRPQLEFIQKHLGEDVLKSWYLKK